MHGSLTLDLAAMLFPLYHPITADPPFSAVLCSSRTKPDRLFVCMYRSLCWTMSAFIRLREGKRFVLADSASHPTPPPPKTNCPPASWALRPDTKQSSKLRKEMGIGSIDSRHCHSQSHPQKAKAATPLLRQEHRSAAVFHRPNLAEATSFPRRCC